MYWLAAAVANLFIETFFYLYHRRFARDNPQISKIATALMYSLGALPVGVIWLLATNEPLLTNVPTQTLIYCLIASFLFSLGILIGYVVDSKIEAAHSAIIHNIKPITVIILGAIILGETLNAPQSIGASIVLISGSLIVFLGTRRKKNRINLKPYYVLAILAAINSGVATIFEKSAIDGLPMATYAVLGWGGQAFFLSLYAHKQFHLIPTLIKKNKLIPIIFLGILRGLSSVTFVFAMKSADNAPLITIIAASKTAPIALGGYLFLREKDHPLIKISIAVATSFGIVLLSQ